MRPEMTDPPPQNVDDKTLLRDARKRGRRCLTAASPKGHGHGGFLHQLPASLVRTLWGDNNLLTLQPAVYVFAEQAPGAGGGAAGPVLEMWQM